MSRMFGFVGLLLVLGIGAYIYKQQIQGTSAPGGATANPRSTVDVTGVRNDLIAIANAERRYYASNGKYASLDELITNGDISMQTPRRGPYSYSSEIGDQTFKIIATYSGPEETSQRTMFIDQTMQISSE